MDDADFRKSAEQLQELVSAARAAGDWKRARELCDVLVIRTSMEHGAHSARCDQAYALRVRVACEAGDRTGVSVSLESMKRPRESIRERGSVHPVEHEEVAVALSEADELDRQSEQLFDAGRWAECEPVTRTMLDLFTWVYGTMHPEVAGTLGRLGVVRQHLSGPAEALPLHQRAFEIYEELFGPESREAAIGLQYLGLTLKDAGQGAKALPVLERYVALMGRLGKAPSPSVERALAELKAAAGPMSRLELFTLVADEVFRDGVVEEHENEILNKLVHFLKLPPDRAKDICRAAKARFRAGELGDARSFDRSKIYARIVAAVHADGQVDGEEAAMLKGMRKLLNIDDAEHARLLEKPRT